MPVALLAAWLATATHDRLPPSRPVLVIAVRQETAERLRPAQVRALDRDVSRAWRRYAEVNVREETDDLTIAADDVLTVVITDRLSATGDGLGWIEFVDGEPSHTIYVSRGLALQLATRGRWAGRHIAEWPSGVREAFLLHALAVGIAHEVGHYLLRSEAHAATGLMRARFTVEQLMKGPTSADRLDTGEEAILRQRVRGYLLARSGARDEARP